VTGDDGSAYFTEDHYVNFTVLRDPENNAFGPGINRSIVDPDTPFDKIIKGSGGGVMDGENR